MNEWRKVKLGDVVYVNQNNFSKEDKWEYINYLDTANITDGIIENIQKLNLEKDTIPSRARRKVLKEDIIISSVRPNLKHFGIIKNPKENMIVSTGFIVLTTIKNVINPYYLYNFFRKENIIEYLSSIAETSTTTYPSITSKVIEELEIKLPPLNIQEKTAKILSDIDEKIELNNKINDNLEKQAQLIFKSWFVDFEPFKDLEVLNWKKDILGNLVTIRRGSSPRPIQNYLSKNGFNWLKISDVSNLTSPFVFETQEKIKEEGLKKTVLLSSGDLVVSNSATPGIPKILNTPCCIHDGWLYFTNSIFSNEFLYLFFKYKKNELVTFGNGSVFTNLKTDILKNIEILIPPKEILNEFNKIIKPIFKMILSSTK